MEEQRQAFDSAENEFVDWMKHPEGGKVVMRSAAWKDRCLWQPSRVRRGRGSNEAGITGRAPLPRRANTAYPRTRRYNPEDCSSVSAHVSLYRTNERGRSLVF